MPLNPTILLYGPGSNNGTFEKKVLIMFTILSGRVLEKKKKKQIDCFASRTRQLAGRPVSWPLTSRWQRQCATPPLNQQNLTESFVSNPVS
jgi:hypothetical protein